MHVFDPQFTTGSECLHAMELIRRPSPELKQINPATVRHGLSMVSYELYEWLPLKPASHLCCKCKALNVPTGFKHVCVMVDRDCM